LRDIRIPRVISEYVIENLNAPAILVGCRATDLLISKPCCEYDILVLSDGNRPHEVMKIGSHWVELLRVPSNSKLLTTIPESVNRVVLNDMYDIRFSSVRDTVINNATRISTKTAIARKLLITCLMRIPEIDRTSQKFPVISSMLLKISAYEIIESLILFYGLTALSLHQLELVRRYLEPNHYETESISLALEIIGVERATNSVLRRSIPSYSRLAVDRYDRPLIEAKIDFLYRSVMIADCYYYVGKICSDIVKSQSSEYWHKYKKLIQTGMDLSIDLEHIQRWSSEIRVVTKQLLESHRTVKAG
jgi:hypothetical protein